MSRGWIFRENNSEVSHAGWLDSSHADCACAFRLREATCLARASGLCAATRPNLAALASLSVAPSTEQTAQLDLPFGIVFPQPRQKWSALGGSTAAIQTLPLASVRRCCVSRVGRIELRVRPEVTPAQRVCATYSAHGATNFPQAEAVPPRWVHIWDMRRQLPVPLTVTL